MDKATKAEAYRLQRFSVARRKRGKRFPSATRNAKNLSRFFKYDRREAK
jgi:hypothetical protein